MQTFEKKSSSPTVAPIFVSQQSSNSQEGISRSLQGTKYARNTTSPTPERQGILPRANSTGAIKSRSSYYNTAISVAGVGNTIIRQVSGMVHERKNSNISYAAAVRNNPDSESNMVVRVYDQSTEPKSINLFKESLDNDGKIVADISRFSAGLEFRYYYATCLHIWGLWYQRAKLLKHLPISKNIMNANEVKIGIFSTLIYQIFRSPANSADQIFHLNLQNAWYAQSQKPSNAASVSSLAIESSPFAQNVSMVVILIIIRSGSGITAYVLLGVDAIVDFRSIWKSV